MLLFWIRIWRARNSPFHNRFELIEGDRPHQLLNLFLGNQEFSLAISLFFLAEFGASPHTGYLLGLWHARKRNNAQTGKDDEEPPHFFFSFPDVRVFFGD
ncbi:MAG TPA: hypothetical protein VFE06_14055 [Acidobacteriaceae bacterium]|nr:hypothetical protein [Acidobacteriaceae bacterium]